LSRRWASLRRDVRWLAIPAGCLLLVGFAYPVGSLVSYSITEPPGGLAHYAEFLGESAYVQILRNTFRTAAVVTAVCLVLGYPYAYLMATSGRTARLVLTLALIVSLWTSLLVRTYAWLVILDRNGPINSGLQTLGIIKEPLTLVHNQIGASIGMVHILLPLMVLPLFAVMRNIDPRLVTAAQSLGAAPARAFKDVFVPLSIPGVAAGCILVFIVALGYYITPALLGDAGSTMLGQLIASQIRTLLNWGLGAAMAAVLLVVTAVLYVVFNRLLRVERVWGA
jgi:ABC-type spermidine/putrescine transport system permease subunit I